MQNIARFESCTVLAEPGDMLRLAVRRGDSTIGELFMLLKDTPGGEMELGWVLHPDHRRQGLAAEFASEAVRIASDELCLGLVSAEFDPENTASQQLCQRIGMHRASPGRWELDFGDGPRPSR